MSPPDLAASQARWQVAAEPEQIRALRRAAETFALLVGATKEVAADVKLAVSEAATNAVLHAYPGADDFGSMTMSMEVEVEDDKLLVRVRDYGVGAHDVSVSRVSPNAGCGNGLRVIAAVTSAHEVCVCEDGGIEVSMRFAFARAHSPDGEGERRERRHLRVLPQP